MKIFAFIIGAVIFLASCYLFALAFTVTGFEALIFTAGILGVSIAFAIPLHLLKRIQP